MTENISLIVPVKDEEKNLVPLVQEIIDLGIHKYPDFEMIFIDDRSKDDSPRILRELMKIHHFIRVFQMDKSHGKSAGWHLGFNQAKGDIIVTLDGDMQNDPRDITPMLQALNEGYDLISGRRRSRADTLWRKIQSRIANHVRKTILRDNALDCGCGIKAFRKKCLVKIPMFKGWHRFMEALFLKSGFRVKQIDVKDRPRKFGVPKANLRNRFIRATTDMFGVLWLGCRSFVYEFKPMDKDKDGNK